MKQNISELVEWAKVHGAEISPEIEFAEDELKGICAFSREELPNAKIKIPEDIIISSELAAKHFPRCAEKGNTWLKFLLCKFKFEKMQPFGPYIRSLPRKLNSPLVWNPAERQLLQNTNLGNSIQEKLHIIFAEWYKWVLKYPQVFDKRAVVSDLELYERYDAVSAEELYENVLDHSSKGEAKVWYSFAAFLWAHLVLLSRAFPEYIIHTQSDECSVMLLPLLDLLNHDPNSKVQWRASDNDFLFEKLEPTSVGQEVSNNYGPKGNEELLLGYGFCQEDNEYDCVALKIKVPLEIIETILMTEQSLQLPILDDYTTFAFENPKRRPNKENRNPLHFKDGVTYYINARDDSCLHPLLDLFSYLSKVEGETWSDLRPRLQGLQSLRAALRLKLDQASAAPEIFCSETYSVVHYRRHCAQVYRTGQRLVLKHSISSLKAIEKNLITQYREQLLNLKKILKNDETFTQDELPSFFMGQDQNKISFDDSLEIIVLWVAAKIKNNTFNLKHHWVERQFTDFIQRSSNMDVSPDIMTLHSELFSHNKPKVSLEELNNAYQFVLANSFTRSSSSNETMLVRNC